jgi:hypothetical protein
MDTQPQTTKPVNNVQAPVTIIGGDEGLTKVLSDDQELAKVLAGVTQDSNNLDFGLPPVTPEPTVTDDVAIDEDDGLKDIKKDALTELRPLVEKLDLIPEEKFNIYLLLIRNTDDKELIAPAHKAAQNINDETKRAQALLEIIKEIDYLSAPEDLAGIKKEALTELRPLVEKLDLIPEEKFNIYLLLIRNSDDKELIAPAHMAARSIADETKRAQALLYIINEIDYLCAPKKPITESIE